MLRESFMSSSLLAMSYVKSSPAHLRRLTHDAEERVMEEVRDLGMKDAKVASTKLLDLDHVAVTVAAARRLIAYLYEGTTERVERYTEAVI